MNIDTVGTRYYGTNLRTRNEEEEDENANSTNDDTGNREREAPVVIHKGPRHQRTLNIWMQ